MHINSTMIDLGLTAPAGELLLLGAVFLFPPNGSLPPFEPFGSRNEPLVGLNGGCPHYLPHYLSPLPPTLNELLTPLRHSYSMT
jgi:hypothetical protein